MLHICKNLALPLEAVTQTFAILAKRGVGKTYLALVMTEEMLKAGLQVVAVDPVGVCWGLRSSADGKRPGLPIVVLGGDHGDVPLEATAGETIANFVIEERQSAVLDLSLFRKNEQVRFMTDLAERLYLKNRSALHLVLDEADAFAPQRPMPGQQRMLGAVQDLVRRGRARGIGVTLVTQRAAVLSKDVLTQVEVLVALRTISPQDRKAVEAWIVAHDVEEKRDAFMESLPSLPVGTAWFWSPGWLDIFTKASVRKRETFDSSATPKAGSRAAQPRKLAPVDLDALRARIRYTIEKAAANDPKQLQRRIAELERHAASRRTEIKTERIEVPVLKDSQLKALERFVSAVQCQGERFSSVIERFTRAAGELAHAVAQASNGHRPPAIRQIHRGAQIPKPEPPKPTGAVVSDIQLRKGERRMLETLISRHPTKLTRAQLGTLSKLRSSSGTFSQYFGNLKRAGLIEEEGGVVSLTESALRSFSPTEGLAPQTPDELLEMWRRALRRGERAMLDALVDAYPRELSKEELAERAGLTTATSGTFGQYLGTIRRNGLVEVSGGMVRASETLFI